MRIFNQRVNLLWVSVFFLLLSEENLTYAQKMKQVYKSEFSHFALEDSFSPLWKFQFAPRYWYSLGNYQKTLYFLTPDQILSRLTYTNLTGQTAEGTWGFNHLSGLFLKGYVGGGSILDGEMYDEDAAYDDEPYSKTYQTQKNGNINYLSVDLGYQWGSKGDWQIGTFIGYHYWHERLNTFGCYQLATDSVICKNLPASVPHMEPIPTTVNTLNNIATLDLLRLGIRGEIPLMDNVSLSSELVYTYGYLTANDFHNLRPSIRGIREEGRGDGFQWESTLNWQLTPDLELGLGGRCWSITTRGFSRVEQTTMMIGPQAVDLAIHRYGFFLQAKYQLNEVSLGSKLYRNDEKNIYWDRLYAGINIGYGGNPRLIYIRGFDPSIYLFPHNLSIQESGFLGGGTVGYNYQWNQVILGIESDLDNTNVGGADGFSTRMPHKIQPSNDDDNVYVTTGNKQVEWLSTIRARLGKLVSKDILVYLTGGSALGGVKLDFDQRKLEETSYNFYSSGSRNQAKAGWVVGTGFEYAVNNTVSFKGEYLYTRLGKLSMESYEETPFGKKHYDINSNFNYNILRLGVNYRF